MPQRDSKAAEKDSKKDDFESVAKRLECDEDKDAFERSLHKIARASSKTAKKSKRR